MNYTIFTEEISNLVVQKMELQNSIIKALEKQAIKGDRQTVLPLLSAHNYHRSWGDNNFRVTDVKAESLIRWNHPEKGWIKPDDFIPLAEETGLIIPLGNWVLFSAARQLQNWRNRNHSDCKDLRERLSPRQFYNPDLVENCKRMIDTYDIDPSDLKTGADRKQSDRQSRQRHQQAQSS